MLKQKLAIIATVIAAVALITVTASADDKEVSS